MGQTKYMIPVINDTFETEDVKGFCLLLLSTVPDYFWEVGASSTGKYHPAYSLGENGLERHSVALVRLLNHLFALDFMQAQYSERERDLMRTAALFHDSRKSGSQEDFEKSKWTRHDHPLLAAEVVRSFKGKELEVSDDEIELIATTIESHMGQWNTGRKSSDPVLPLPKSKYQKLLHMVDYLASRKDIEILWDDIPPCQEI